MGFSRREVDRAIKGLSNSTGGVQNRSHHPVSLEVLVEKLITISDWSNEREAEENEEDSYPIKSPTGNSWAQKDPGCLVTVDSTVVHSDDRSRPSFSEHTGISSSSLSVPDAGTRTREKLVPLEAHSKGQTANVSHKSLARLEDENQSMRDETTCKICMDNQSCIVFLPCGHLVTCAECAPAMHKCPICRSLVRGTVKAYPA